MTRVPTDQPSSGAFRGAPPLPPAMAEAIAQACLGKGRRSLFEPFVACLQTTWSRTCATYAAIAKESTPGVSLTTAKAIRAAFDREDLGAVRALLKNLNDATQEQLFVRAHELHRYGALESVREGELSFLLDSSPIKRRGWSDAVLNTVVRPVVRDLLINPPPAWGTREEGIRPGRRGRGPGTLRKGDFTRSLVTELDWLCRSLPGLSSRESVMLSRRAARTLVRFRELPLWQSFIVKAGARPIFSVVDPSELDKETRKKARAKRRRLPAG